MQDQRVLARQLTRELTVEELELVSGGRTKATGKPTWSGGNPDGEVDIKYEF